MPGKGKPFLKGVPHRAGCLCATCPTQHRHGRPGWPKTAAGHPIGRMAGTKNPNYRGGKIWAFGSGWKAARRAVWARDLVCRSCGFPPDPKRRLDVHHVVERRNGGTNDLSNLVGLHNRCHGKVHAHRNSSAVERAPVKRQVEGSIPSSGASFCS